MRALQLDTAAGGKATQLQISSRQATPLLATATAGKALTGRLTEKMRYRPYDKIKMMMPTGVGELKELPRRSDPPFAALGLVEGTASYCAAVEKVGGVFARGQRTLETSLEHENYMLRVCRLPREAEMLLVWGLIGV